MAADGQRFLAVGQTGTGSAGESATSELILVLNRFTELVERAGPAG